MGKTITIPKNVSSKNDLDFDFLRKTGIEYIEKIGSKLWTDYNTHDPGVTILEMLSYAITDLSLRIEMPIQNILSSEDKNLAKMHEQFLSAVKILPTKPVTPLDYRKLFVHHKGVKNAWIVKHNQKVYLNCQDHSMSYTPFKIDKKNQKEFLLKGLNDIYLDLEENVKDPEAVFKKIKTLYHKNRNLCEDLVGISKIPEHPVSICAYIDIAPDADEEKIQALIIKALGNYLAPSVSFYSLKQMYDKGYTTDQIFDGPTPLLGSCIEADEDFQGGFIDSKELKDASLRNEVRLSDIIQIIMKIEGVKIIKDISINSCKQGQAEQDPWIICIEENHKPVLCWDNNESCKDCTNSLFYFSKGHLPIGVNKERVKEILADLDLKEKQAREKIITEDVVFPQGRYSKIEEYTTIQNDFPQTYGISAVGLPGNASKGRRAKAKQLKAYLLFFDQVLANYFSHLSKIKDLLSVDDSLKKLYTVHAISELSPSEKQTYFTQKVADLNEIDSLVDPVSYEEKLIEIANNLKENSLDAEDNSLDVEDNTFFKRRNQLLDHLIARFAERFSDYAFIMKMIYGESNAKYEVLKAKTKFVEDYQGISCERGLGFNYCDPPVWDTNNVAGTQKRIARLTGISDYSRRNLLSDSIEIYDEKDKTDDALIEYRWRIKNGDEILISSSKHYHHLGDALKELFLAFELAKDLKNYDLKKTKNGESYFNIINPAITDKKSENYIVARNIEYRTTEAQSVQKINEIVAYLDDLTSYEEGMYFIEHILLRPDTYDKSKADKKSKLAKGLSPDAEPDTFMPSCIGDDCEICGPLDPYSFRVSVILPGWTTRFANKDFRSYMEKIIRDEIPAHVLARICWIGHVKGVIPDAENDMLHMQEKYRLFLEQLTLQCASGPLSKDEITTYRDTLKKFIPYFNNLHTIYKTGKLHDCDNDATETEGNKIVLGRTNIGNL